LQAFENNQLYFFDHLGPSFALNSSRVYEQDGNRIAAMCRKGKYGGWQSSDIIGNVHATRSKSGQQIHPGSS
jgi:hypothetical protein